MALAGSAALLAGCFLTLNGDELTSGSNDDAGASDGGALDGASTPTSDAARDTGAAGSRYAAAVLADKPILYLRLDDPPGTVAKATVGADGMYTVAGVTQGVPGALAGDPGTAVTFTDGSGRLTIPADTAFAGAAPLSVELWAKPSATNTTIGVLVDQTDYSIDRRGWNLLAGTSGVALERWSNATPKSAAVVVQSLVVGVWHHVVGTFDGTTQRLYVDGVRTGQGGGIPIPARASTLTVGHQSCDPCGGSSAFHGDVDEIAVYAKALTDAEVAAHFAAAK